MRKIEATIDPWIVQDVREALARVGVTDIALCDVRCTDVVKAVTGVAVASVGRILIAAVERAATASAAPSGRWSFGARAGRIGAGSQDPAIAPAHSTGGPSAPTGLSSRSG